MENNSGNYALWGGRFTCGNQELMKQFNESFSIDKRMFLQDIEASIEWAQSLLKVSLINENEFQSLKSGLEQIMNEWKEGRFEAKTGDEDIHTANERRLKVKKKKSILILSLIINSTRK